MAGVFGLLGRRPQRCANITLFKRDGSQAYYQALAVTSFQVITEYGASWEACGIKVNADEAADSSSSSAASISTADELAKMAELHKMGTLSDKELAAQKANLLDS